MATSADAFLADLEDLEEDFEFLGTNAFQQDQEQDINDQQSSPKKLQDSSDTLAQVVGASSSHQSGEDAKLTISQMLLNLEFQSLMEEINQKSDLEISDSLKFSEDDDEYKLVSKCNSLIQEIEAEILTVFNEIRSVYQSRFPELDSIVHNPYDYMCCVQRIKNETDISKVDFSGLNLASQVVMTISIQSSTQSQNSLLTDEKLEYCLTGCEEAFRLSDHKTTVFTYVSHRMIFFCPNVSALLTAPLAARLVTAAGGILNLSRMVAQNLMLVGSLKKNLLGFAGASQGSGGIITLSEIVLSQPTLKTRIRAIRLLAGKTAIAARCDAHRSSENGETGYRLREEILKALYTAALPPPSKQKKPLPRPDDVPCQKRGGKKHRAVKEKVTGAVEIQKQGNRVRFGDLEAQEVPQEMMGYGLGMVSVTSTRGGRSDYVGGVLGASDKGGASFSQGGKKNLIDNTGMQNIKLQKKANARRQQQLAAGGQRDSGMSSSLAFTATDGIELVAPQAEKKANVGGQDRYFSNSTGFVNLDQGKKD